MKKLRRKSEAWREYLLYPTEEELHALHPYLFQ